MSCACGGPLHLSNCPGRLSVCLEPGYVFDATVQLLDAQRQPMNWPAGTATRLRIHWGTGTQLLIDGVVDGSYLRFNMSAAQTKNIPRGATVAVDVNYDAGDPTMWRPWREGRVGASC